LIVILIFFSIPIKFENSGAKKAEKSFIELRNSAFSMNISDYVTFVGPPINTTPAPYINNFRIYIDDADPYYNWSKTSSENSWLTGSGTPGDPYIIENLFIDADRDGGGIRIVRSTKNFIIRDNWINNSGPNEYNSGILLKDTVENGIIENNLITYVHIGINLEFFCGNITIRDNYLLSDHSTAGNGRSLQVTRSNDITLIGNVAIDFYHGVLFINNENITFSKNFIKDDIWGEDYIASPVDLRYSNNTKITYNGFGGVYTHSDSFIFMVDSTGNVIFNNSQTITQSGLGISGVEGLQMQASNTALLYLFNSHNNQIAHNFKFLSDSNQGVPGFDLNLLIGITGIAFIVVLMLQRKKH